MTNIEIIFLVLSVFIIILIVFLINLLCKLSKLVSNFLEKMKYFDSSLKSISNVGDILECKSLKLKENCVIDELKEEIDLEDRKRSKLIEILDLLISIRQACKKP
jgi:uncharacterized protein YoxC